MLGFEEISGNTVLQGASGFGSVSATQQMVDITKRAGQRLRTEGVSGVKFIVSSEETEEKSLALAQAILADPTARQYVGVIGYHTYPYGSAYCDVPTILSTSGAGQPIASRIAVRGQLRDLAKQYGVKLWMTEVSHGNVSPRSFDDLRGRAIHIHDELLYAEVGAYFGELNLWDLTSQQSHFGNSNLDSAEGNITHINNSTNEVYITGIGYAIGHYARWIKPGAARIDATSSNALVQVSAFHDKVRQKLVLVLINNSQKNQVISASLNGLVDTQPLNFTGEQSTASANWKALPAFNSDTPSRFSLTLPSLSVTTISASIVAPAQISGSIALESCFNPAQPLTFEFRPIGGAFFSRNVTMGADGSFSIGALPRASYRIAIKGSKWLQRVVSVDTTGGDVAGVAAALLAGDADNNNRVDMSDFSILVSAYNSDAKIPGSGYVPAADFNCDDSVDATDFGLLVGNYGVQGDL